MPNEAYFKEFGSFGQPLYWAACLYEAFQLPASQLAFALIGLTTVLVLLWQVAAFWAPYLRPSKIQIYCHSKIGSWALVTGASDGIGYAFAEELLGCGFNVLLHGRNPEKLGRVQGELAQMFPRRKIDTVIADASAYDDGSEVVANKVKSLPGQLTVLVNNVGGLPTRRQFVSYSEATPDEIDATINLNARFPARLINALMPVLKESQPSIIINCGSSSALLGIPYVTTYSGTKAFLHSLSQSLKTEMVAEGLEGIDVLGCVIGNTISAGNKNHVPFFTISSKDCARGCLDRVGGSEAVAFCHWKSALHAMLAWLAPTETARGYLIQEMVKRKENEMKGM